LVHKRFRLKQGLAAIQALSRLKPANLRRAVLTAYYLPAAWVDAMRLKRL
jgi:hypothetical protein